MKNSIALLIISLSVLLTVSCRKDFSTVPSYGNLTFSSDTIFLDTIFSNISTSTYALKVYNKSGKDIEIPSINLGRNKSSFYRLNVDGFSGKSFENVTLRSKDSLYVFIEGTIDASGLTDAIYKDSIIFDSGDKMQDVKLITLVKDSHFLYANLTADQIKKLKSEVDNNTNLTDEEKKNQKNIIFDNHQTLSVYGDTIPKRVLDVSELHFTNEKAYVFYDYCIVPDGETLVIDPGTELHFQENTALVIGENANIQINGTLDEKVIFEGGRLEFLYDDIAGQWDGLWLQKESTNNLINHTIIKNARTGIICDSISSSNTTPTLQIKNSEIYNCSEYGIYADASFIEAENVVIGSSRLGSLAIVNGGSYNFNHATIANYWSEGIRRHPSLFINNFSTKVNEDETTTEVANDLTLANFTNCIITGNNSKEIVYEKNEGSVFNIFFKNCIIEYNGTSEDVLLNFDDTNYYQNIFLNKELHFRDRQANDYQIGEESEAINNADLTEALKTPLDIMEVDRTTTPDIGAYQHIIFETEEEENQ